ncbi:hypothetical protein JHK87_027559 [Glycine soja]|nr:hypothetical protein JHK87_027559 [Glycine soja]
MDDLERLKKIRNHHGLRHYWGLRVRGQHTKCTGRRELVLPSSSVTLTLTTFTTLLINRLPNSFTTKEKIMHAKAVMAQLGLTMCKDNIIGGPLVRGVGFWREEEKG